MPSKVKCDECTAGCVCESVLDNLLKQDNLMIIAADDGGTVHPTVNYVIDY